MRQLNLFSNKICAYCDIVIPLSIKNNNILNGFLDQDTGAYVCWLCRDSHYQKKNLTVFKNLYSEFPLTV